MYAGRLAAGAAIGLALAFVYVVATIDRTLFCHGGLAESYGPMVAFGLLLWCAFALLVLVRRKSLGPLLFVYGVTYAVCLVALAASASTIWGPTSCTGFGF